MAASNRNHFLAIQGETFVLNIVYKDIEGNLVNLTGHSVTLFVRGHDGEAVGEYEADVNSVGDVTVKVSDEETTTWPNGNNKYVLQHDAPNGDRKFVSYGTLTVLGVE